jgi:hypothetical protein
MAYRLFDLSESSTEAPHLRVVGREALPVGIRVPLVRFNPSLCALASFQAPASIPSSLNLVGSKIFK